MSNELPRNDAPKGIAMLAHRGACLQINSVTSHRFATSNVDASGFERSALCKHSFIKSSLWSGLPLVNGSEGSSCFSCAVTFPWCTISVARIDSINDFLKVRFCSSSMCAVMHVGVSIAACQVVAAWWFSRIDFPLYRTAHEDIVFSSKLLLWPG